MARVLNPELIETCKRYDAAPGEGFQLKRGVVDTPVEPLAGDTRTGAAGIAGRVVKFQVFDQPLVPPELVAFTRQ